ncbi:ornithine cyclodeaminase family protein [Bradyrhizobium sp. USDA 4469]
MSAIWITEADVVELMAMPQAIAALRAGLIEEAEDRAYNMVKTHAVYDGHSTLHAIGAVYPGRRIVGTKTWTHTDGGACPLLLLFSADDGQLVAIIEAFALGQMRTGGISGLATDYMARPEARTMAMIGSGKQSITQVAAVAAVRALHRVLAWSPTPEKRIAFAKETAQRVGIDVRAVDTLREAVEDADIITLATRARTPFLDETMPRRGAHINAVGAIALDRAEFTEGVIERADLLAADSVPQVRNLSREFRDAFSADEKQWGRFRRLSDLLASQAPRPADADVTLFKAMGMGVSDLALGIALLDKARAAGRGRPLPLISRARPRLDAIQVVTKETEQ